MAWIPRLASIPSVSDHQIPPFGSVTACLYPPLVQPLLVCLWYSPDSEVPACIAPLRPVYIPGSHSGSVTLATLGSSAFGFCPCFRCPCGVLCARQRGLVLMVSAVACGLDPSSYLLPFGLDDTVCRVACPLLPGFPPPLLSSIYTLSALQVSVVVPSCSLLRYRVESSRCGHPSGSSLSQSSIGAKALPPPSWCVGGVFAMRSP